MSADVTYKVVVLRLVEDIIEVRAVISDEAEEIASKLPNVARVLKVYPKEEDNE